MSDSEVNGKVVPVRRTAEESEIADKSAGQRRVNILWEVNQALLAFLVTMAEIYCTIYKIESKTLDAGFAMILTAYFLRTNHTKIGGIGGTDSR